jgi:hypothetical protein
MVATSHPRHYWLNALSMVLLFPATYVIVISILKYGLGIDGTFDASAPLLESMGIKDQPGWKNTLLIVYGPWQSLLFSALQVLHLHWHFSREQAELRKTVNKKWLLLAIALIAGLVLFVLAVYQIGENLKIG